MTGYPPPMLPRDVIADHLENLDPPPTDRETAEAAADALLDALIDAGYQLTTLPTDEERFTCRLDGLELDLSDVTRHLETNHGMTLDRYITVTAPPVTDPTALRFADIVTRRQK